jgi:hypothetical protein
MLFGDGSDGASTINDAGTHQQSTPKFYTTLDIAVGAIVTNGWPIFCRTSFVMSTSSAGIRSPGGNASTSTRGLYNSTLGGPHGSICPSNGLGAAAPYSYIGQNHYGLGGSGGVGGGSAPTGTTIVSPQGAYKKFPYLSVGATGDIGLVLAGSDSVTPGFRCDSLRGGGAGAPGAPASASTPGAGGAAGGLVVVCAPTITLASGCSVSSHGGNGGAGTGTTGNGGGGGGGGAFLFVCETFVDNGAIYQATKGTGGLGGGAGAPGSDGTDGNTTPFVVLVRT